jgi:hypothetical protein
MQVSRRTIGDGTPALRPLDACGEDISFGFLAEDRHDGGRVDEHQRVHMALRSASEPGQGLGPAFASARSARTARRWARGLKSARVPLMFKGLDHGLGDADLSTLGKLAGQFVSTKISNVKRGCQRPSLYVDVK